MKINDAELFRAFLLKMTTGEYWYVGLTHHLAMDGWGFSNWARRLGKLYNNESMTVTNAGDWQAIALSDQDYLNSKKYQIDQAYWLQQQTQFDVEKLLTPHYQTLSNADEPVASQREIITIKPNQFAAIDAFAQRHHVG